MKIAPTSRVEAKGSSLDEAFEGRKEKKEEENYAYPNHYRGRREVFCSFTGQMLGTDLGHTLSVMKTDHVSGRRRRPVFVITRHNSHLANLGS